MSGGDEPSRVMRCPRCGYDVSGLPPTWQTQCPLRSVCSECGLEFAWGDLLNPQLTMPPWLYEHPGRHGPRLSAMISTTVRACFPWHFWKHVRLVHPADPRRLALLLGAWIIALYVGVLAMLIIREIVYIHMMGARFRFWRDGFHHVIWPRHMLRPFFIVVLVAYVLTPLTFVLLPDSRRLSRVRLIHVARATLYGMAGMAMISLTWLAAWFLAMALWDLSPVGSPMEWLGEVMLVPLRPLWILAMLVWLLTWWSYVTGRYMKMHMWPLVTLSIVIIGVLASFLALIGFALLPGW